MRGSTRKRGKTWTAYWDLPPLEPGERRQTSKGGFKRKKDAQAFLDETLTTVRAGTYVEPSREPLARFLRDEWLPAIRSTVRPLTFETYESNVRRIAAFSIGAVPLRNLSGGDLNGFYGELEQRGLSVGTRRLTHAILHRALNDAVRWGKLARNPADAADPPSAPQSRVTAWTASELYRFLAHVESDRLAALWRLAATTGMRRGELLGLTWRALDLEGARLEVSQQLVPTRGGVTLGPPKRARSLRAIALDPETCASLRRHREAQLLERDFTGDAYQDQDLVFCDPLGAPIHPNRLTEWFGRHREAAGIPTGTLHVLRHTAATLALSSGVPVHVTAARLGDHPKTVLGTYAHLLPSSDEQAAEQVAAQLAGAAR